MIFGTKGGENGGILSHKFDLLPSLDRLRNDASAIPLHVYRQLIFADVENRTKDRTQHKGTKDLVMQGNAFPREFHSTTCFVPRTER